MSPAFVARAGIIKKAPWNREPESLCVDKPTRTGNATRIAFHAAY